MMLDFVAEISEKYFFLKKVLLIDLESGAFYRPVRILLVVD